MNRNIEGYMKKDWFLTSVPFLYKKAFELAVGILMLCAFGITRSAWANPVLISDLGNRVAISGTPVTLQIEASDTAPKTYQWQFDGVVIPNATNTLLNFDSVQINNAGKYRVIVSDSTGSVTSRLATLTVKNYPNPATIAAWGDNTYGQTNLPEGETNVVALASGGAYDTIFLRRDGTMGDFGGYEIVSPATYRALPLVAAVNCGGTYGLAIQNDGTPISFGLTLYAGASDVPTSVSNAVATTIGEPRLAVLDNGTLAGWNANPDYVYPSDPAHILPAISNLMSVADIAMSGTRCLVLFSNHSVAAVGTSAPGDANVIPTLTNVGAVSAGNNFNLALRLDGTVVAWGNDDMGQTNVPIGLSNVMAVAAGQYHALALQSNGMVVAWGDNSYGQCNVPSTLSNVVYISAGFNHSAVLTKQAGISTPPQDQYAVVGGQATFTVAATGYPVLNYQWSFNGTNLPNATNSSLTLTNVMFTDAGAYACTVSNVFGPAVTGSAMLSVRPRTTPRLDSVHYWPGWGLVFAVDNLSGHGPVIIYATTNIANGWLPISTNPPTTNGIFFIDYAAPSFPVRFYRAVEE